MIKNVLLLSFFYPPDLSAGSFRSQALVDALLLQGVKVEVLTTSPNRYSSHTPETNAVQSEDGLRVHRVMLPRFRIGFLGQALAFLIYACWVLKLCRNKRYDVVVATSSRLMTAVLGAEVCRRVGARLYLDLRDLFVENLQVIFSGRLARLMTRVFEPLERWAVGRAEHVNLVSLGFMSYFHKHYPRVPLSVHTNGVDQVFTEFDFMRGVVDGSTHQSVVKVLYAGNVGDGQGLHSIVPVLALALMGKVEFTIVGAGGRLQKLEQAVAGLANVRLHEPVARDELLALYRNADVLFLHLNDHPAFKRVLPSKLFEYAATGKPIWAGVGGYAAEFLGEQLSNVALFKPCDSRGALDCFEQLSLEPVDRSAFVEKYARNSIMQRMADEIVQLGSARC